MTDAELLAAFPGQATRFERVDDVNRARVGIESFEVAGVRFRVYMCPGADDKLDQVLFSPIADDDQHDSTFQALENLLVEKYGHPWKSTESAHDEIQWVFKTTRISLARIELPRLPRMPRRILIHLTYSRRIDNPL